MKIVKPRVTSFTFRSFLILGRQQLCVTCMVPFALEERGRRLLTEQEMWAAVGEATEGAVIDEGLPKPCGEVLVHGSCSPPNGRPVPLSMVRVRVAPIDPDPRRTVDKRLAVIGDRYWRSGTFGTALTDPEPFTEMPLGWERAFGGEAYAKNPLGKGIARVPRPDGTEQVPLPNVENPSSLISSPSQRPEPAGFGLLPMGVPQRQSRAGTYDARWFEEDFPGYARDTHPTFFCTALPDQRVEGFFRGDEEYLVENMHPSRAALRGRLPAVAARVLLRRVGAADLEDVKLELDTLLMLPGKELGILVFRGLTHVADDEAVDIAHALVACEEMGQPLPVDHYRAALDARLDRDKSPRIALKEDDLVPAFAAGTGMGDIELPPEDVPEPEPDAADAELEESERALADAGVSAPEAPQPDAAPQPGTGPPELEAPALLATLKQASIEMDPDIERRLAELQAADASALETYRTGAHFTPPVAPLSDEERVRTRTHAAELRALGESFAGRDWTAYDLSGHDLQRGDFRGTLLERANLTRTNLAGADMSRAVLAHATLLETCFDGATLEKASLGATLVQGTSFAACNLRSAILACADLQSASFANADLTGVDWFETRIGTVRFDGAILPKTTFFFGHDLTRCRFAAAKLVNSNFLEGAADGVDFSGADLERVTFMTMSARGADFRGASMKRFVAFDRCSFEGANFEGADLTDATMKGSDLRGANLEGACLQGADLSECDLSGAKLSATQAKELRLIRSNLTDATLRGSNLMEAMLQKATLHGADLSSTNLYQANLSLTRLSTTTKVTGANLKRALMVPRARKGT